MRPEEKLIDEAWTAVAGHAVRPEVTVAGSDGLLPSVLPTGPTATATVVAALAAAARFNRRAAVTVDREHVATAVRSERAFRIDDQPAGATFAALSRFWPTADGFVRTHANYPWHRDALLRALDLPPHAAPNTVAAELSSRRAGDVEERVFTEGGVTAQVRSTTEWQQHPQGAAVSLEPLVGHAVAGAAEPKVRSRADMPAGDVRVLDLTRVIAGPVCTRFLGALGADVLRIDPPDHFDIPPGMFADTLLAKRSAVLDLTASADRLHVLLGDADVLVCGYRPGSLDRFGLTDDDLAERHPGLVVVRLAAWGHTGPWQHRRGFDSVVQAAVGIADVEAGDDQPGALPCQLLDHGTGYLAAAAVLDGLRRQATEGGTVVRRLSLARTAVWLLSAGLSGAATSEPGTPVQGWTTRVGPVSAIAPPGRLDGQALRWPAPPTRFLADDPTWG